MGQKKSYVWDLYFKYVLFMEIWLTYGTAWVLENVFSNFEDLN
jgi:hypothetical protein